MSDAEQTIRHNIFSGLIQNWHKKDEQNFVELTKEEIFSHLFDKTTLWAIEEYLEEIKNKNYGT